MPSSENRRAAPAKFWRLISSWWPAPDHPTQPQYMIENGIWQRKRYNSNSKAWIYLSKTRWFLRLRPSIKVLLHGLFAKVAGDIFSTWRGTRGSGQAQIVSNGHHLHKDSSTTLPQKKQHGKPQTNNIYLKSKTRRPVSWYINTCRPPCHI